MEWEGVFLFLFSAFGGVMVKGDRKRVTNNMF